MECEGSTSGSNTGATVFSTTSPSANIAAGECAAKQIEQIVSGLLTEVAADTVRVGETTTIPWICAASTVVASIRTPTHNRTAAFVHADRIGSTLLTCST